MVRVEVIAYAATDFLEETDITIGKAREIVEKYAVTWINVLDPDGKTLEELEALFGFHPLALEDATNQNLAPKVDVFDNVVFIVARTIVWTEEIGTDPISMFVGKKFVVTINDKVFAQLEDVRIRLRKRDPRLMKRGADFLAYSLLDVLVESYFPHVDRLQNIIDDLEEKALGDPSRDTASTIHQFRRDLLTLRNALRPQRDAFDQLARTEIAVFSKATREYLRDAYDHMIQTLDRLDTLREVSASLMEVYLTVVNNSLNEVMKTLTVISTVILPLSLIASIYGMNVTFPGKEDVGGFAASIALMVVVGAVMILYFRRRKWF